MNLPLSIYAAGPIDLGQDVPDWRKQLSMMLDLSGISSVLFDPATAYKTASWGKPDHARSLYIEQVNRMALDLANTFVACVPKKVPSIGTPIEIEFADKSSGVNNSYIITDIPRGKSVYLDNRFSEDHWILVEDLTNTESVTLGLAALADKLINQSAPPREHSGEWNDE